MELKSLGGWRSYENRRHTEQTRARGNEPRRAGILGPRDRRSDERHIPMCSESSAEHIRQDGDQTNLAGACYMVFHGELRHLPERVRNDPENRGGDTSLSVLGRSVQYRFRVPQVKKPTPWPGVQGRRVNRELNQKYTHNENTLSLGRGKRMDSFPVQRPF